jgi:hypothetical protein
MREGVKAPEFMSRLDRSQDECAVKRRQLEPFRGDLYSCKSGSDKEVFECRVKDNCYTLKSGMGACPCGLQE